jgi:predicted secreted protein
MTQLMKNWRAMRGLGLSLSVALLVACSTAEKVKPVVGPSVVQSPGQKSITVSDAQSGASIVLERGQALIVRLPIRGAAGREWTLVDLKPGVLAVPSSRFERALRDSNPEEADGATVWHFSPDAAGTVAVRFDLRRPHSLQPAEQTVTYAVTVK